VPIFIFASKTTIFGGFSRKSSVIADVVEQSFISVAIVCTKMERFGSALVVLCTKLGRC
jgi:hypothetical protein